MLRSRQAGSITASQYFNALGIRTEKEVSINASGMMKSIPCHEVRQKRILHREILTSTIVGTPVEKTGETGFIEEESDQCDESLSITVAIETAGSHHIQCGHPEVWRE